VDPGHLTLPLLQPTRAGLAAGRVPGALARRGGKLAHGRGPGEPRLTPQWKHLDGLATTWSRFPWDRSWRRWLTWPSYLALPAQKPDYWLCSGTAGRQWLPRILAASGPVQPNDDAWNGPVGAAWIGMPEHGTQHRRQRRFLWQLWTQHRPGSPRVPPSRIVRLYDYVNNDAEPRDDFGHGTMLQESLPPVAKTPWEIAGVAWRPRLLVTRH